MADTEASPGFMEKLLAYIRTRKGIILLAEIVLSFITMICYAASMYSGYSTVAIVEMVLAIIFFIVYMMGFDKEFQVISWPWSDAIRTAVGALLYIITSLICVIGGSGDGGRLAGGVFGLIAGIVFAYDTYTCFLEIKSSRGHSTVSTDA